MPQSLRPEAPPISREMQLLPPPSCQRTNGPARLSPHQPFPAYWPGADARLVECAGSQPARPLLSTQLLAYQSVGKTQFRKSVKSVKRTFPVFPKSLSLACGDDRDRTGNLRLA